MDGYNGHAFEGECPLCCTFDDVWPESKLCIDELYPLLYFAHLTANSFLERCGLNARMFEPHVLVTDNKFIYVMI